MIFNEREAWVTLPQTGNGALGMEISCRQSDWQLSSLAQICSTSFPRTLIPTVEHHYIHRGAWPPNWQDDIEISQWLELLHPFTAVKDLYISEGLIPHIAPALKDTRWGKSVGIVTCPTDSFFYRRHSWNLYRKLLGSSLRRDRLPVNPSLLPTGMEGSLNFDKR